MELFNPGAAGFFENPYDQYRHLREAEPVYWSNLVKGWIVTSYEHCEKGLKDSHFSANRVPAILCRLPEDIQEQMSAAKKILEDWVLMLDPPEHQQTREWLTKSFPDQFSAAIENTVHITIVDILKVLDAKRSVDMISEVSYPLPVNVIGNILGISPTRFSWLKDRSHAITKLFDLGIRPDPEVALQSQKSILELNEFFAEHISDKNKVKDSEIITSLLNRAEAAQFSNEKILSSLMLLLFAGHETTTNLLGNGFYFLLNSLETLTKLKENPLLWGKAVEEILRYDAPVQILGRIALDDVELGGKEIKKTNRVLFMIGAANRDPKVFSEPEEFNIFRKEHKHLSFGLGRHFCLGASLARLEAKLCFSEFFKNFPETQLAKEKNIQWRPDISLRGLKELLVTI